jgi:predicted Zn-dependent peptidase
MVQDGKDGWMSEQVTSYPSVHRRLDCGIELAVMPMPGRTIAALEIRVLAGYAHEDAAHLGVAYVAGEAVSKGTAHFDARGLSDAFDAIGASHGTFTGRETLGFSSLCLPEFLPRLIELHAEMICTPSFPPDACETAVELSRQSLSALEDDPQELAKKLLHRQAYGEPLGRHVLGEAETLARIGRAEILAHWERQFAASRMLVGVAGAVDADRVAKLLERCFAGLGTSDGGGPSWFPLEFRPGRRHLDKELEQEQVALCFPGSAVVDPDHPVEQVLVGVLAGGMSARLFTEIREKQGLVYWVGAWSDQPRRGGMIHVGASSTPQNVSRTYTTILRELDRVGEDVTPSEVQRAITGIVARTQTQGDVTRARANQLVNDLFFYGHPVPTEEKLARIRSVTSEDIARYLMNHKRDALSVITLGPAPIETG